jgi:hypothetical protein
MSDIVTEFDMPAPVAAEPRMNVLALDLGTHCGWALARGATLTYGTKNLSARKGDGAGQRWLKFRAMLANHYNAAGGLHAIYFEDVKAHGPKDKPNTIAAHVYGGFLAHLEAWCDVQRVRLVPVGVGQVKKSWTGAGNASKDKMIAEARRRGFKVGDEEDDTADALAILHLAIEMETR